MSILAVQIKLSKLVFFIALYGFLLALMHTLYLAIFPFILNYGRNFTFEAESSYDCITFMLI